MKKIVLVTMLLCLSAFAQAEKSWDQILNSHGKYKVAPSFVPGGNLFNLCASGDDKLKSIKPVSVCVETELERAGRENDIYVKNCVRYEKRNKVYPCLLYTSPSPRDQRGSRMPSSA